MNICPNCNYRGAQKVCPRDGFPMVDEARVSRKREMPDLIGKVFENRYEVQSLIGRGGMGWVFKAQHLIMQHEVALKVLRKEHGENLKAIKRFYQEARSCSRLKQPHTIKVYDFGASEDGFLYLTMEFLEGQSLRQVIKRSGPIHPRRVIHVARQICESLDEAHELGMVHRDLKPDNVFLVRMHRKRDYVKVLDFGISKYVEGAPNDESLTKAGLVMGTPKYMSPEQAQAKEVDRRSDLYSLGVIMYEMLTGKVPFKAPNTGALLLMHINEPPPPLPDRINDWQIPPELRKVTEQLLAKLPSQRIGSAAELESQLAVIDKVLENEEDGLPAHTGPSRPLRVVGSNESRASGVVSAASRAPSVAAAAVAVAPASVPRIDSPNGGVPMAVGQSEPSSAVLQPAKSERRPQLAQWILAGTAVVLLAVVLSFWFSNHGEPQIRSGDPVAAAGEVAVAAPKLAPSAAPETKAIPPVATTAPDANSPSVAARVDASAPATGDALPHATAAVRPDAGLAAESTSVAMAVVEVRSVPPGATLREEGQIIGQTPYQAKVSRDQERKFTFDLVGFERSEAKINVSSAPGIEVTLKPKGQAGAKDGNRGSKGGKGNKRGHGTGYEIDYL